MSIYRSDEGPYTKKDFEVVVELPHKSVPNFITFKHCNLPIMGIGPKGPENAFMIFDKYFDLSVLKKIYAEIIEAKQKKHLIFNQIVAIGIIPTQANKQKSIDSYIHNINKYAYDDKWKEDINKLTRRGDIKIYFHDYFNIKNAWDGIAMLRKYTGIYADKTQPSEWLSLIEHFPLLRRFVESLPFKYIGYVMVFKSTGKNPVFIHRDSYPANNTVNFINFRLSPKKRPFFIYDFNTDKKIYVNENAQSYFFNEIDAHGIDQETESHLTLRVEGQFLDAFKSQIGINNFDTFNWEFEHCRQYLNSGQFKIENNTDI
ncbi:MAG: hypothetical protein WA160_05545 [Pseudobdellovibrio sp.]